MTAGWRLEVTWLLLLVLALAPPGRQAQPEMGATSGAANNKQPPMLVDTKFWIRNTEFGEPENWLAGLKPCTLLERISLNEESVVSLGDSLDSLGGSLGQSSNIRDLSLALNGLLLLEEDTFSEDPLDPLFIQFLNQSGDCVESDILNNNDAQVERERERVFLFQPEADQLSWFNPANWRSNLNEIEINDLIPESHGVPCGEDLVVFGSREAAAFEQTIETNERAKILTFKVNFKASEFFADNKRDNSFKNSQIRLNNLRVSRMKIGNQFYNQLEFNRLIQSDQYRNILFEFNNSQNVLRPETDDYDLINQQPLLTIDESSFQIDSSGLPVCLDEAGCLCGNEDDNVMKTICSFNLPLEISDQPCHDPISSTGYCNKICATILVISMDPMKFSEPLVTSMINKILEGEDMPSSEIFAGARRTYDNKYEITFRLVPDKNLNEAYESILGSERRVAELIYNHLNSPATKSFYGIKSIIMKSSNQWKANNRSFIFWLTMSILLPIAMGVFVYQEASNERLAPEPEAGNLSFAKLSTTLWNYLHSLSYHSNDETSESFISYEQTNPDERHPNETGFSIEQECSTQIPLVKFADTNLVATDDLDQQLTLD